MTQLGLELPEPPASGDGEAIGPCNDLLNALVAGFRAERPELAERHFGSVLGTRLVVIDRTGHWIPEEMREFEGDAVHAALTAPRCPAPAAPGP